MEHQQLRREVINGTVFVLEYIPEGMRSEPEEAYCLCMRNEGAEEEDYDEVAFAATREELESDYIDWERDHSESDTLIRLRQSAASRSETPLAVLDHFGVDFELRPLTSNEVERMKAFGFDVSTKWQVSYLPRLQRSILHFPFVSNEGVETPVSTSVFLTLAE